jgi:phosphoglycolate phosphatase
LSRTFAIFDFDGTLVDSLTDVALCFNEALQCNGFPPYPLEEYQHFIGGNLETIVSKLLPEHASSPKAIDAVKTKYREIYLACPKENSLPYPGVYAMLDELVARGVTLAVNTNKGQTLVDALCATLFPHYSFAGVVGYTDDYPSKPDPYGARMLMRQAGASPGQTVYVGDGKNDILTAQAAGIDCALCLWGQGTDDDKHDPRVWRFVATTSELTAAILDSEEHSASF